MQLLSNECWLTFCLYIITMLHIQEKFPAKDTIAIHVNGRLDKATLSSLKEICRRHCGKDKKIMLLLSGLLRADKEARDFLKSIRRQVVFVDMPEFLRLEIMGE